MDSTDTLQTGVFTVVALLAFWAIVVLVKDRKQVQLEGPKKEPTEGSLASLTVQSEIMGWLIALLVPATVVSVVLAWGDAYAWWLVVLAAIISYGIAAAVTQGLTRAEVTFNGTSTMASQPLLSRVSLYTAAVCAGLVVAELPQLRQYFDTGWLEFMNYNVMDSGLTGAFAWGVVMTIVGLGIVWLGSSCFRLERRQTVGWFVGVILLFVGNTQAFFPYVFAFPLQVVPIPWLLTLLAVMLPTALTMVVCRPYLHGEREVALCKDVALGLMAWVMLRWLLWPGFTPLHGFTWDTFLIRLAPRVLVCFGVVLAACALNVCGLWRMVHHKGDEAAIWVAESVVSTRNLEAKLGTTVYVCGIPVLGVTMLGATATSVGTPNVTDDMREMVQKSVCWKNYVLPAMLFAGLLVAYSSVRNYFAGSWLVAWAFMIWLINYSIGFADNKVTPSRYLGTCVWAGTFVAVEIWLVSCGFLAAAIAAAGCAWYLRGQWTAFRGAGGANERAFVTKCIVAVAVFAVCVMAKTGFSPRRWLFLGLSLAMALAALWMTFHDDLPKVEVVDGRRRGMSAMRFGIAAGFGVLVLAIALAAPGSAAIVPSGTKASDPMRQGYHGTTVNVTFGDPDRLVSARYQTVDDLLTVNETQAQSLPASPTIAGAVDGKHLVVWATYADGTQTRADYWAYQDDGSWSQPAEDFIFSSLSGE